MKELSIEEKAKAYDKAIEIARRINSGDGVPAPSDWTICEVIFPVLKESDDEKIRNTIIRFFKDQYSNETKMYDGCVTVGDAIDWLENQSQENMIEALHLEYEKGKADGLSEQRKEWTTEDLLNRNEIADILQEYNRDDLIDWLEKQAKCETDYHFNHQDANYPNGCIVLEDCRGGEGFYKIHLDYLNKKQVEEVEEMVRMWNKESKTSNEDIKNCIGMCLTDACEQRFKDYNTSLKDCLDWLEKQTNMLEKQGEKPCNVSPIDDFATEFEKQVSYLIASSINKENDYTADYVKWASNALLNYAKKELEKHDKHNPYSGVSFDYNGHTWGMCAREGGVEILFDGELKAFISEKKSFIYPIHLQPYLSHKSAMESAKEEKVDNQNCVKPTNKVEPKFHEGEWVVYNSQNAVSPICQITKVDGYIELKGLQGERFRTEYWDLNENYHHWTIDSAKCGDVLALSYASKNYILIYKGLYEKDFKTMMSVFCFYCVEEDTYYDETDSFHVLNHGEIITPATKEQRDILFAKMHEAGYEWDAEDNVPKEIEQKLTDKAESKFKVGDWIVFNRTDSSREIMYVYDIRDGRYYFNDNIHFSWSVKECDEKSHLWSIKDAKDGDVLACENGWTCIFKTLINDETFSSYCFMDNTKWFCETGSECHTLKEEFVKAYNGKIYPATKEQRDLLFAKMKEAGYVWDAEKKEPKKIKGGRPLLSDFFKSEYERGKADAVKEMKNIWSEKDEEFLKRAIKAAKGVYPMTANWLKSIKNRITNEN